MLNHAERRSTLPNQDLQEVNAFVQGLRELADFYAQHPEVKLPYHGSPSCPLGVYSPTKEEVVIAARAFGEAEKKYEGSYFRLKKIFSGGVALEFFVDRDVVCTAREVDQKFEPGYVIPAQHIPSRMVPVLAYDCHPLLAPEPTPEPIPEPTLPEEKE